MIYINCNLLSLINKESEYYFYDRTSEKMKPINSTRQGALQIARILQKGWTCLINLSIIHKLL